MRAPCLSIHRHIHIYIYIYDKDKCVHIHVVPFEIVQRHLDLKYLYTHVHTYIYIYTHIHATSDRRSESTFPVDRHTEVNPFGPIDIDTTVANSLEGERERHATAFGTLCFDQRTTKRGEKVWMRRSEVIDR